MTEEDHALELLRSFARSDASLIERFMIESNAIEGETGMNPGDLAAAQSFLWGRITEATVLGAHAKLGEHLGVDWTGRWRECNVRVGDHVFPPHGDVPRLMKSFFRALGRLDSWEAHNRFEVIHPFRDLNGRVGRLIWLHKAIDEGYAGRPGFLRKYYYQTLSKTKQPR